MERVQIFCGKEKKKVGPPLAGFLVWSFDQLDLEYQGQLKRTKIF